MDVIAQKTRRLLNFDKALIIVYFMVLSTMIDCVAQYYTCGFCFYFSRAIFALSGMTILCFLHALGVLRAKLLLTISLYFIFLNIFITLFYGHSDPGFRFEPYFLKVQVLLCAMFFAIGLFISINHILYLLAINLVFISLSIFLYPDYPIFQFAFYGVIISGCGYMAYVSRSSMLDFYREKESNRRITLVNEELREINQSKDDLFRIIGHDLRTPFHQLSGLISVIDKVETEEEKEQVKEMIRDSAEKGTQLLEDLLAWSMIYRKKAKPKLEQTAIATIVDKVFEFSDMKRKNKEIKLVNKIPIDLKIVINPAMMETVLRNLVANAIKFSNRGSKIVVKSHEIGKHVIIAVEDKGVGMNKETVEKLFTAERNISTKGTENEEGTGFGLSIAKKLVEKQNGIFEIASNVNEGTTISMYFPIEISE